MKNLAHLKPGSIFYRIFPDGNVPIFNIFPEAAICEGDQGDRPQAVYMVDVKKLVPNQLDALVHLVFEQCRKPGDTLEDCRSDIMSKGLPLRAALVDTTSCDCPIFL